MAFSHVKALEYRYPFLWVGTDEGVYRYDGGQWAQMFVSDSSETYNVRNLLTTPAATYIGTTDGLLRFADDQMTEVEDFAGWDIAGLCRTDKGVVVATRGNGIFTFNGKEKLVSPEQLTPSFYEDGDGNELIAETVPDFAIENTEY